MSEVAETAARQPQTALDGALALPFLLVLGAAISAALAVSGNLLALGGINYVGAGGVPLQKFHPATYIAAIGLALYLVSGDLRQRLDSVFGRHPGLVYFLCVSVLLLAYVTLILQEPFSQIVDTWLCAGFVAALLGLISEPQRQRLSMLVYVLLLANNVYGIVEFVLARPLIPPVLLDYSIDGGAAIDVSQWAFERAYGLLGHPLTSSLVCCAASVAMYAKIAFDKVDLGRVFVLGHSLVALIVFGGRTSLAVTALMCALISIVRLLSFFQGRGARLGVMMSTLAFVCITPFVTYLAFSAGAFDALLARMADDNGSATTRLVALDLLQTAPPMDLLLGDVNHDLMRRQVDAGTTYGVEIAWVAFILQYGIVAAGLVFVGLFWLLAEIARQRSSEIYWMIAAFLLAISSGTGFATKTMLITILVIMCVTLFPPRGAIADMEDLPQEAESDEPALTATVVS